ncbi:MAG: nuclear transport factor 2 family protein [Gammaproteobacteria bacterium]|nr:nuclear transport factor 2 family protein [Gammaproteobacteria bacterium]
MPRLRNTRARPSDLDGVSGRSSVGITLDARTLTKSFIESFCNADLAGLETLLSENFHLKGPLFEFDTRTAYLESLEGNLEADPEASILSIVAEDNEVTVFYTYKENLISQHFRCNQGKIVDTILVFNTQNIAK